MANHQTGTATGIVNLLQQIVTWLVVQGWTSNMSQADGNGWRAHLSKNGKYVNLRALRNENTRPQGGYGYAIAMNTGTGFSSGSAWNSQAGTPITLASSYPIVEAMTLLDAAIPSYQFFDDGADNILIVAERSSNLFVYIGWGELAKAGAWTGGAYITGSSAGTNIDTATEHSTYPYTAECPGVWTDDYGQPRTHVRADVDSFTGKWVGFGYNEQTTYSTGKSGKSPIFSWKEYSGPGYAQFYDIPNYMYLQDRLFSAMNAQAVLLPVHLYVVRDGGGMSMLGKIPGVFAATATSLGIGATFQIGADDYKVYPNFVVKLA